MKRTTLVASLAAISMVVAAPALAAPGGDPGKPEGAGQPTGGGTTASYIVQFTPGADRAAEVASARARGIVVTAEYDAAISGMAVLVNAGQVTALRAHPSVALVEPDAEVTALTLTPTDQPNATWGIDEVDGAVSGTYSYTSTGAGVDAYVIDTGIRAGHTQFAGRVSTGASFIKGSKTADDCNGHGTHVAGTIAGTTYGVAKLAQLVPVKVLNCQGSGTTSSLLSGINWVITTHAAAKPAVANLSLGFGGAVSTVDTAIQNLVNDNVTVVVAAGNSNVDACGVSPARAANALTVGATDSSRTRASFSNWGTCLDVFAPGVGITSAWSTSNTAISTISGTSMAAPHVAGVAARILGVNISWTPEQVTTEIVGTAKASLTGPLPAGSPNLLLYRAALS